VTSLLNGTVTLAVLVEAAEVAVEAEAEAVLPVRSSGQASDSLTTESLTAIQAIHTRTTIFQTSTSFLYTEVKVQAKAGNRTLKS